MTGLDKYSKDIKQLCLSHKVKRLYAFGSILTANFNSDSDIDFVVDFEPFDIIEYADNYYNLKFALEKVLRRPVDLLEEKAISNPYFTKVVDEQRQLIYGMRS